MKVSQVDLLTCCGIAAQASVFRQSDLLPTVFGKPRNQLERIFEVYHVPQLRFHVERLELLQKCRISWRWCIGKVTLHRQRHQQTIFDRNQSVRYPNSPHTKYDHAEPTPKVASTPPCSRRAQGQNENSGTLSWSSHASCQ